MDTTNNSSGTPKVLTYKSFPIRQRKDGLINITDIWKAEGKPRKGRLDEWIKSRSLQAELRAIAKDKLLLPTYYPDGSISGIPGILEVVKGGLPGSQGVFGHARFAIGYARLLSSQCGHWAEAEFLAEEAQTNHAKGLPDVFEGKRVRYVGTLEKPEWIAQDVCDVLDNGLAANALRNFDDDEHGVYSIHIVESSGRKRVQEVLTVTEPGLYRLIFNSRKPVAKRFKRWIWHEVVPSIRKTGSYSLLSTNLDLEQQIELWRERLASRLKLKDKMRVELVDAALVYVRNHRLNPIKVLSEMHDAINERFQGIKAKEIRSRNGFSKRVLLRDHYERDPLEEVSSINRLGANKIKRYNMHPVQAIHEACDDFLKDDHVPQPFSIVENVHAQGCRLQAALDRKQLAQKDYQLSLPLVWDDGQATC